jgi:hypothetical protein
MSVESDEHGSLTPEEAVAGYRAVRRSLLMAVPVAWLVVALIIAKRPGSVWVTLLVVVALLYAVACRIALGYVKREMFSRVSRSGGRPNVGP